MNKTNKITTLMITGVLSLGLMSNSTYCAAAPELSLDIAMPRNSVEIVHELITACRTGNLHEAFTIAKEIVLSANKNEIFAVMMEFVKTLNLNIDEMHKIKTSLEKFITTLRRRIISSAHWHDIETSLIELSTILDVKSYQIEPIAKEHIPTLDFDKLRELNAIIREFIPTLDFDKAHEINAIIIEFMPMLMPIINDFMAPFTAGGLTIDSFRDIETIVRELIIAEPELVAKIVTARNSVKNFCEHDELLDILFESVVVAIERFSDTERAFIIGHLMNQRLVIAIKKGSIDKVESLLAQGASVDAIDFTLGYSVLMLAIQGRHQNIAKLLIEKKVNVNHVNNNGGECTALELAILNNDAELVTLLINANANVNCAIGGHYGSLDNDARTLLEIAINQFDTEIIELLVNAGANITGDTLTFAFKTNSLISVEILMEGLLIRCLRAQKCGRSLGTYAAVDGHIHGNCENLTQLSGDPLNRVLWYINAQDCVALRQICDGMTQLQPDLYGLRMMLRQAACRELLRIQEEYSDKSITLNPEITHFITALTKFLQEEIDAPVCNIDLWKTLVKQKIESIRKTIKQELPDQETTNDESPIVEEISNDEIHALECLMRVVENYFNMSQEMFQTPVAEQCPSLIDEQEEVENTDSTSLALAIVPYEETVVVQPAAENTGAICSRFTAEDNDEEYEAGLCKRATTTCRNVLWTMAQRLMPSQENVTATAGRAPVAAAAMAAAAAVDLTTPTIAVPAACAVAAASSDGQEPVAPAPTIAAPAASASDDEEPVRTREQMRAMMADVHGERVQNGQNTNHKRDSQ